MKIRRKVPLAVFVNFICIFVFCLLLYIYWLNFLFKPKFGPSEFRTLPINIGQTSEDNLIPESIENLDQKDSVLHNFIYSRHLTAPSKEPYNIPSGGANHANKFTATVETILKNKDNGVFIEAGAFNGVGLSNTLYFEKELGWTGLLVECNPYIVPDLKLKNRKAWVAGVCLSTSTHSKTVNFSIPVSWPISARIGAPINLTFDIKSDWTTLQVPSFPLYALMSAISIFEVDFFSLDVESSEIHVLKTIPWDKVKIKIFLIAVYLFSAEEKDEMNTIMKSNGYVLYKDFISHRLYVLSTVVQ